MVPVPEALSPKDRRRVHTSPARSGALSGVSTTHRTTPSTVTVGQ